MDVGKWFADNGDYTHRLNYDLNENSIVFDLGGYEGWFTQHINEKFGSNIFCYEPLPEYANKIVTKFWNDINILVYDLGVSNENKKEKIYLHGDSTSMHLKSGDFVEIECITMKQAMEDNNVKIIDLLKISIEGEEYPLLEYMIENKLLENCINIQVQFHNFVPNYQERYNNIRKELEKTHELTYYYPFVWENWKKK